MDGSKTLPRKDKDAWKVLGRIWKVIGSHDGAVIVSSILREDGIRTGELIQKSGIPQSKVFPKLKMLVELKILEREVDQNRNVSYRVSGFGKEVLSTGAKVIEEFLKIKRPE
ncbi:MAG: hypothetical protein KGH52_03490 [Candidatus Micrarchaeota archaeon]|nr:hypothetical protein [Candidatus Micrarchaeota archaeon]